MDINADMAVFAGGVSTLIFAGSVMPMIVKAFRTRDLASYSLANLLMSNTGNVVHSVYVYSLPAGPIWVLHAFYLVSTALMLAMYLRHSYLDCRRLHRSPHEALRKTGRSTDVAAVVGFLESDQPGSTRP